MKLSEDFRDLLMELGKAEVDYLLIGGYAVALHCKPRYTKDIDIWIRSSDDNYQRLIQALEAFGAPRQVGADVMTGPADEIVWFGNPPNRVDILKHIPGVEFAPAFESRVIFELQDGVKASVISLADLLAAKRAAGRPQDLLDAAMLETIVATS